MCELVFTGKTTSLTHFFHDSCLVPCCLRTTAREAYVRSRGLLGNCSCWLSSALEAMKAATEPWMLPK